MMILHLDYFLLSCLLSIEIYIGTIDLVDIFHIYFYQNTSNVPLKCPDLSFV
jgi:hypothetical protein